MERITERDVIRYALRMLKENIISGMGNLEKETQKTEERYLRKIEKMLPKYQG